MNPPGKEMEKEMTRVFRVSDDVVAAGKKKATECGVEFVFPPWIVCVPGDKQEAAICRAQVHTAAKMKRDADIAKDRAERKAARKAVIEEIESAGFSLVYSNLSDYVISLAYEEEDVDSLRGQTNMMVYFSVCSKEDLKRFSREESRKRLAKRIRECDTKHVFFCSIPSDARHREMFVVHRFLEHATVVSDGMPHALVKSIRSAAMMMNASRIMSR